MFQKSINDKGRCRKILLQQSNVMQDEKSYLHSLINYSSCASKCYYIDKRGNWNWCLYLDVLLTYGFVSFTFYGCCYPIVSVLLRKIQPNISFPVLFLICKRYIKMHKSILKHYWQTISIFSELHQKETTSIIRG